MINKKQFIELMQEYQRLLFVEKEIDNAMKMLDDDFGCFSMREATYLFEKTISLAMNDIGDWIPYFVYDCEWGERDMTVVVGGKRFKLKTLSKLYDIITTDVNELKEGKK